MLRVEETLEIIIPEEGLDVNRLEEALAETFREFQKRVMSRALEEMEKRVLEEEQGRMVKKGRRRRYLCTRLGWIHFPRQPVLARDRPGKVRYLEEGRYGFPLDEALGLRPHQQETDWVRKRGIELACDHPYRQARDLLAQGTGEVLSHRTLHRWVSVKDPCGTRGGERAGQRRGGCEAEGLRGGGYSSLPSGSLWDGIL